MNLTEQQSDQIEHILNNIGREIKEIRQILGVAREEHLNHVRCKWLIGGECWAYMPDSKLRCTPENCHVCTSDKEVQYSDKDILEDLIDW